MLTNFFLKHKQSSSRGFSLLEVLVYLALLILFSVGAVSLLFSLEDVLAMQKGDRVVVEAANGTFERLLLEIRQSDEVLTAGSVLNTSPGTLQLSQGADTATIYLSNGSVWLQENGVNRGSLSSDSVEITDLRFYFYDNGRTEMIRISMTASTTVGERTTNETFKAAAILRGSYD